MTRRAWFSLALALSPNDTVDIPVHVIFDGKVPWAPQKLSYFWKDLWPEALVNLGRARIHLTMTAGPGEMERPSGREPIILGLRAKTLNLLLTDTIPVQWDMGRALNGVTALYRGHHLCMLAMNWAHGNQFPVVSVNTCLHELLHALLGDIFEVRPKGVSGQAREYRVDLCATRLWLFHDGGDLRTAAAAYASRLRA